MRRYFKMPKHDRDHLVLTRKPAFENPAAFLASRRAEREAKKAVPALHPRWSRERALMHRLAFHRESCVLTLPEGSGRHAIARAHTRLRRSRE